MNFTLNPSYVLDGFGVAFLQPSVMRFQVIATRWRYVHYQKLKRLTGQRPEVKANYLEVRHLTPCLVHSKQSSCLHLTGFVCVSGTVTGIMQVLKL